MSLSDLEQHVLAYFVATSANDLSIATRWYPHGELILILEDKVSIAVRKFGVKARGCAKAAATLFVDHMVAKGAWATKKNDYGGSMHQFQADTYRAELKEMQASNPLIQQAEGAGPDFWTGKFADLTA